MVLNLMLAHADSAGARWLAWVTTASLEAALLFVLGGLVWLAVRGRVAPQIGYGLFLLVPLKLLVPVTVPVPPVLARWTLMGQEAPWSRPTAPETPFSPASTPPAATEGLSLAPARVAERVPQPPAVTHVRAAPAVSRSGPTAGPVASVPARLSPDPFGLSWPALAMTAWGAAVVVLTGRFVVAQWRFRARLGRASPVDLSRWAVDFAALCRSAGVSPAVGLVEADGVAAPAVWGVFRPTILLPRGIAKELTEPQLRWVLLHELAHVRRRDLVVVTLQRVVSIVHFFNPVVWVANRVIHELREYACDDAALALGRASAVESGEAFVRVLRHAAGARRGLEGALGVFGLDSRNCCLRRVRRLLDGARPIRTATGARWFVAWVVLAALTVPHLRADGGARPQAGPQRPAAAEGGQHAEKAVAGETQVFELRVVGSGGRPVPAAEVELRTEPSLTAGRVRQGTFVRQKRYGSVVATDAEGRLAVALPREPKSLDVFMTIPGFGPYWAGWSSQTHAEPIPQSFTAELEPAWTVGGVVVDDAGIPVAGANVFPHIEFKKRPGVTAQLGSGTELKTDDAGRWHFDSVPDSMGEVSVSVDHPTHMPVQRLLARNGFGLERGQEPTARILLTRGVTVSGKVTDESGAPIAGARVRTKSNNAIREATTGPDGIYHIVGCEPRTVRIVAWAKEKATDMRELTLDPAMGPVDFRMKPGGHVRIRVVDAQGKPVPRSRIFFQRWRGMFQYFEFDPKDQYADANGVWEWHEAPPDEVKADICPPEGMQLTLQTITSRPEEYVLKITGPLVVSGKVVDAATSKPVESFQVVPGWRSAPDRLFWDQRGSFTATGGRYKLRQDRVESELLVRIEADGYQAAVSRAIRSTEGRVTVDFALQPGKGVAATVLAPDGRPAAKARIALGIDGSQIAVKNGDIDDTSTYAARAETDAAGHFHFAAQDAAFVLVVTHPSGFGFIHSGPDRHLAETIRLDPWVRVEGTFRIGKAAVGGVPIRLESNGAFSYGPNAPHVSSQHEAVSGRDGRFVFERVVPGQGGLGRNITLVVDQGATEVTSSCWVGTDLPAGKTVHVDLGGSGRPVVGKLLPAAGAEAPARWSFALVTAMPADAESRAKRVSLTATVDRNGAFRIDDVPAGHYTMMVRFDQHDAGSLREHPFEVPPSVGDVSGPPVDLGVLQLQRR